MKRIWVKPYTKKNGSRVKGHYRSLPMRQRKFTDGALIYDFQKKANWASFGIWGYIPMQQERKEEKKVVDSDRTTLLSEDYGPQRFCKECGMKLVSYYDRKTGDEVYLHPETDCKYSEEIMGHVLSDGEMVTDPRMVSGHADHSNMTMVALKEVYKGLRGKAVDWLKENKDVLKEIYVDHADDAGEMEKETLPLLYNEEGELITDTDPEDIEARWEAPIRIDGVTELTKEEVHILEYASYVLPYNAQKVKDKLRKTTNIRKEKKKHIMELVHLFRGFEYPKKERYIANTKLPKNWHQMQDAVSWELMDENFMRRDWEYESRYQLALLG